MKTNIFIIAVSFLFLELGTLNCFAQGISINETGNAPAGCAILEVQPDVNFNKGLLLPRLTTAQRATIASPVEGLIIYNTTTSCFEIYKRFTDFIVKLMGI